MKRVKTCCPRPPVGLFAAHKEALTLHKSVWPYARRRLERVRFNLDAALPWVEVSQYEARKEDLLWLLAVASEVVTTSQQVSYLLRLKAFNDTDWARQARQILVAIEQLLSRYAEAIGDANWDRLDEPSDEASAA